MENFFPLDIVLVLNPDVHVALLNVSICSLKVLMLSVSL